MINTEIESEADMEKAVAQKPLTQELQIVFELVCEAAREGRRCPTTAEPEYELQKLFAEREPLLKLPKQALFMLDRKGYLKIEVHRREWRIAEILFGPDKGKRTLEPPAEYRQPKSFVQPPPPKPVDYRRRQPWKPGDPRPI